MRRLLAVPFLAAVLACSSGSSSSTPPPVKVKLTPAKGGNVAVDNFRLEVPPNAVAADVLLQIVGNKKFTSAVGERLGASYATIPTDLTFLVPATVTFGYAELGIPAGGSENDLQIAFLGPSGLPTFLTTTLDTTKKTATATIDHGGTLALVLQPTPNVPDNGSGTLVFLREAGAGLYDLWKSDPAGGAAVLLTAHTPGEVLTGPRVAQGASRVAFTETAGGEGFPRAWIVNLDGSGRVMVTTDGSDEIAGDLDATGTFLYVSHREPGAPFADLAVYNLTAGPPFPRQLLTSTPSNGEANPRLSPDGQVLLFQDVEGLLYRMPPTPGGAVKPVTKLAVVSFAWRPDSQRIVVQRPLSASGGTGQAPSGGGLLEINPLKVYTSLGTALKGSGGAVRPTYTPNSENFVFEYDDPDASVQAKTLRQIPRQGLTGTTPTVSGILLGGASAVFLGGAPASAP
jgi:hypothetical protein